MKTEDYGSRFSFYWGYLDDGSIWVQPPSNNVFNIDYNTLSAVLDLNGGLSVATVSRKYGAPEEEVSAVLARFQREGALIEPSHARITFEPKEEDISLTGYLILFLFLIYFHLQYFSSYARTFFLSKSWEVVIITLIAIGVIFFHEMGHYIFAQKYFKGKTKIAFGFSFIFPVVYVDTHEAWRLPRNKRLLINSSGLFADCVVNVCAIALVINYPSLERYVTPLLLTQFTRLSLILNPLFPTDGYWILADLTKTVNLSDTAFQHLRKLRPDVYSLYSALSLVFSILSLVGLFWFAGNLFHKLVGAIGLRIF
jgi:hypothetical protein